MRKQLLASTLLGLGFSLHSLNLLADAPKVAVDIAPLHSLVSQVMEGVAEPDLIIPAESSPHEYALRPSQARALAEANVVFWMGEELTPWLEKAMNNVAGSAQKVAVLDLESTTTYAFREGATFEGHAHHEDEEHHDEHGHDDDHKHEEHKDEHDHHDHHKDEHDHHDEHEHDDHKEGHDEDAHRGHGHEGIDPHAWLDPENAKAWVNEIKDVLSKQDPENAKTYASNAEKAVAELDKLIEDVQVQMDKLGKPKFIVFHDAYQYFEKRFGVPATGSISLSDAEDPSPARIEAIRNTVKKLHVHCVYAEPQYDSGLVDNVFEGTEVETTGVIDPVGASFKAGSQHYAKLIKAMASALSECK